MEVLKPSKLTQPEFATYPWDEWLDVDGYPKRIRRGEDFTLASTTSLRQYFYKQATAHGVKVALKVENNNAIIFQVYHPSQQRPILPVTGAPGKKKKAKK